MVEGLHRHEQRIEKKDLINNCVFGKTMENVWNHRDIKFVATNKRRSTLALDLNYHTTDYFSEKLIVIEINKTNVKMS